MERVWEGEGNVKRITGKMQSEGERGKYGGKCEGKRNQEERVKSGEKQKRKKVGKQTNESVRKRK